MNIFFDLDGTLTDPGEGIVACIRHALVELGQPVPSVEVMRNCIGPPLQASFHELLGTDDAALAREGVRLYRERFVSVGMYENEVYPGIESCLEALAAAGHRLRVATSKPKVYAEQILVHFDLRSRFEAVYGSELDGIRTDKGELLRYALDDSGVGPAGSIMVGDRRHDIIGASRNNLAGIGVLWGYGSRAELEAAGAAGFANEVSDLPAVVQRLPVLFKEE